MWYVAPTMASSVLVPGCRCLRCRLHNKLFVSFDFGESGVSILGWWGSLVSLSLVDNCSRPDFFREILNLRKACPFGVGAFLRRALKISGKCSLCSRRNNRSLVSHTSSVWRCGSLILFSCLVRQFVMNRRHHNIIRMECWNSENFSHGLIMAMMGAVRMAALVSGNWFGMWNTGVGHSCSGHRIHGGPSHHNLLLIRV